MLTDGDEIFAAQLGRVISFAIYFGEVCLHALDIFIESAGTFCFGFLVHGGGGWGRHVVQIIRGDDVAMGFRLDSEVFSAGVRCC